MTTDHDRDQLAREAAAHRARLQPAPRRPAGDDLPDRLQPKSLADALDPIRENVRRMYRQQRRVNQPLDVRPGAFHEPACTTCHDARWVRTGVVGYQALYGPCPDCAELARREAAARLNRRWPLDDWTESVAAAPWLDRPDAPRSHVARRYQQQLIEQLPAGGVLFLCGPSGTGKSRLLAEMAVAARARGLSSIFRTGEGLRRIFQERGHDQASEARLAQRKAIAWSDLTTADVVCLDEVDDIRGEAFPGQLLDLLNARLGAGKLVAVAGNDVAAKLPAPIVSRLTAADALHVDLTGDADARPIFGHTFQPLPFDEEASDADVA